MTNSKQIVVLTGGGHKGAVKLTAMAGSAKGTCSLDHRPTGATLYLVGDDIAAVPLKDMTTTFNVPFLSDGEASCLVRSSSLTMFGGAMSHSELIKRVDSHLKNAAKPSYAPHTTNDAQAGPPFKANDIPSPEDAHGDEADDMSKDADSAEQKIFEGQDTASHGESQTPPNDAKKDALLKPAGEKGARSALSDIMSERDRFDGNNFYYAVKPQLDEMFVCYPEETLLTATVEQSKWVRIDAADGPYAVGILYDGADPAFICYAVPERTSRRRPPAEIEDMCVWLPVSSRDTVGYWVIYQSAKTGEIIK